MSWFSRLSQLSNDPKTNQGSDGSPSYVRNKKCECVIGQYSTSAVVSFKPYINKLSYSIESSQLEQKNPSGATEKEITYATDSLYVSIDLGLDLLAHSINEGINNQKRINELYGMFVSIHTSDQFKAAYPDLLRNLTHPKNNVFVKNIMILSLNSLIGVNLTKGVRVDSFDKLIKYGVPGFIESFDFSIDKELGYFEYNGSLIPKKHTLNIKFKVSNIAYAALNNNEFLWLPNFYGKYYTNDSMSFPLGLKNDKTNLSTGSDRSSTFTNNKNCFIQIESTGDSGNDNEKNLNFFKPFDLDISKTFKYKDVQIEQASNSGGSFVFNPKSTVAVEADVKVSFSILNHSINEAILNTNTLQRIFRILDTYYPSKAPNMKALNWANTVYSSPPEVFFTINNLVNTHNVKKSSYSVWNEFIETGSMEFIIKSFSFEIDKEIGFFEYNGLLLHKKINLSFTLRPLIRQGKVLGLNEKLSNPPSFVSKEDRNDYYPAYVKRIF